MLDPIACGSGKLSDPMVERWALRRYEYALRRGSQQCQSMEQAWFHDLALRRLIDGDDHEALEAAFRALPSRLFANLKDAILERWSGWSGQLGASATPVLAEYPIEEVRPLLIRHLEEGLLDLEKSLAVIAVLTSLPAAEARALLDEAAARVSNMDEGDSVRGVLLQALLQPTAILNPGALLPLAERCAHALRGDREAGNRLLHGICLVLPGDDALREKAKDVLDGRHVPPFRSLQPVFASGAPLEDCDRILAEPEPWPAARALLEKHGGPSAATETALAIATIIDSLDAADPEDMACFAIAAVLHAFARDEIGADSLSMDAALDILALDLSYNRHVLKLTERLGGFGAADLARNLSERMPAIWDEWGAVHLINLAGDLQLVDMIAPLIDCLDEDSGDVLCETAQRALARIGEPAVLALIARWDTLDGSQRIYGCRVLEAVGGEPTLRFAVDRFRDLFRNDQEGWCALVEAVPDRQIIDLLAPEVRRRQPVIDECFHLLCVLTGHEHADLQQVGERIKTHRQRILQRRADIAAGNFAGADGTVTLTLRCEKCGDVNSYDVKSVVTGTSASGPVCFVGDDLPCTSCGEWADFEFTGEAHLQMIATLLTHAVATNSGGDGSEGPLRRIDVNYRWQRRPAREVMAEAKEAVARYPENVVNHLRLGRIQYVFGRRGRARECYGRALQLEPESLEAGLGIAQVMADTGEPRNAFDKLCEMLERRSGWRFFRTDEVSPRRLTQDFVQLFNRLHSQLGVRDRALLHTSAMQHTARVGRNDLCPCGSGKKYKKCCRDAGASIVTASLNQGSAWSPESILRRDAS